MSPAARRLTPPRRVLIIKPSSLGDVVTAIPVLRALRRTFPEARICWVINPSCAELIHHDSDLDEVILFDRYRLGLAWRSIGAAIDLAKLLMHLKEESFDWVIDLQGLLRSSLLAAVSLARVRAGFADAREGARAFYTHTVRPSALHTVDRNIALARGVGLDPSGEDMTLQVSEAGTAFAQQLCQDHGIERGSFLVCIPPTRWKTKLYPVRHWRAVISELIRHTPVVVLGAPRDKELCGRIVEALGPSVIDLASKISVEQMVGVIAASSGVICSDSAGKFIAPAVGVQVVCLIGPTRPELTGPYPTGKSIVADVPCTGCLKRRCRHITCMELIRPADVIDAAMQLLTAEST